MKGKKVLAIDDEAIVLESIRRVLTEEGFEVDVSLSARAGIRMAAEESYDIVLTDIRMPDVDGLTVVRDVKRQKPQMPVVIITGYASVASAVQAMKLGAVNYIEKPFDPEELIRIVVSAIEAATGSVPEEQTLIHAEEVRKVLMKGAAEPDFARKVFEEGGEALGPYKLTANEKLAIVTGDVDWLEDQLGMIKPEQKHWLTEGKKHMKQ
ncbi:MAG: response regulator [Thermodesulfobacteriota bacterium]